jgi:hypothetical protein
MTFVALEAQDPLGIALRQAQGDSSLDDKREVILLRVLKGKEHAHTDQAFSRDTGL